jgi:pimeloyl-ACP methyl ester carboxylesterase
VSGVLEPRHVTDAILGQWAAVEVRCADVTWPYCASRWRDFTPLTHVRRGDPPALLFAGDNDAGVPYEGSERFAAALRFVGTPARVILGHGTGHLDTSWYGDERNTAALLRFLRGSTEPSPGR